MLIRQGVSPTLARASARYLVKHPWQLALAILGIALGIAVVVAVDLANEGARRSFRLSTELVTGSATHHILSNAGGVPEEIYRQLRVELGFRRSAPVIEGNASIVAIPGRTLKVLGVDPFAEARWRSRLTGRGRDLRPLTSLLTNPLGVLVAPGLAAELGLRTGDQLELFAGAGRHNLQILGFVPDAGQGAAAQDLLMVDIATAQRVFALYGRLSRIDLSLTEEREAARVGALLPPGVALESAASRNDAVASLSDAFHLNLTAMSLLALIVGMFLIYNTVTFAVVQRRPLLGRLRAIGVGRDELFKIVLLEAFVLGCVGTCLGLVLGLWIGNSLLDLVSRTVDDLYYSLTVREFSVAPMSLIKGAALGLCATVVSAWLPAREAAAAPPAAVLLRSDLERGARARLPRLVGFGCAGLVLGTAVLAWPAGGIRAGFLGLFLIVFGCTFLTPPLVALLARLARTAARGRVELRMAARDLDRQLSRTGVAIAALTVAIATTVGVGIMVDSFRRSVGAWLDQLLVADVYVSPATFGLGDEHVRLDPRIVNALRTLPGVAGVSTYRSREVMLSGRLAMLIALDLAPPARAGYRIAGDSSKAWERFDHETSVLVSEPLAYHHQLAVGDTITLPAATAPAALKVAGIYYSYGSEHGRILIRSSLYQSLWNDPAIGSSAVYVRPGANLSGVIRNIERSVGSMQEIRISRSRDIREASLRVFDRTFTVTGVLRLLAMGVAFIGVLSALMALLLERTREFAILRATGMTGGELGRLICFQTSFLGLCAGVLAIPTGLVLGTILIFVINRRAFGWTMQFHVAPDILLEAVALAVLAALLAGVYPAWRAARTDIASALRTE